MTLGEGPGTPKGLSGSEPDLLDSWKQIAAYLQRDVRTVMRWEHARELPVHRLPGGPRGAVYALRSELEAWRATATHPGGFPKERESRARESRLARWAPLLIAAILLAAAVSGHRPSFRGAPDPTLPEIRLAVLPFENLTQDPGQDYFVDGIHDALITDIARLGGVRVISRTSVMPFRGTTKPARHIARELEADVLVEGSVLRVGDRVRITAQLVRAATDEHIWAASYDRDLVDVLGLLRETSRDLAGQVRLALGRHPDENADSQPGAVPRQVPPDAYEAYLRAQAAFNELTPRGFDSALASYRQALALEPDFALAWGGVANTRAVQAFFGFVPGTSALPEARHAAQRALALDEGLGEAHGAQGFIALYLDRDLETAGRALERAVALSPTSTLVRHYYADYWLVRGDVDESLKQTRIGRSYDPMTRLAHGIVLYHALMARRYDEVVTEGRKAQHAFPGPWGVQEVVARALWHQGKYDEAVREWAVLADAGDEGLLALVAAYRAGGTQAALRARAEWMAAIAGRGRVNAVEVASWLAAAGDRDRALEWLERSYARREGFLLHVAADPNFDKVRSDSRFQNLLRRIGVGRPVANGDPRPPPVPRGS